MRELDRSAGELGLLATMLVGYPGGDALLDDARYAPILARLEELAVPLYIHPGPPLPVVQRPYYGGLDKEVTARPTTNAPPSPMATPNGCCGWAGWADLNGGALT